MDPIKMSNGIFAFQKTAFNQAMDAMHAIFDQNKKIAESWDNGDGGLPGQAMTAAAGWNKSLMQSMEAYRDMVNSGFDNMESMFSLPMQTPKEQEQTE